MSSRTRGDTRTVAAAAAAAASLENSIEGNGEEESEVVVFSPPRYRKNRGTSDNEVVDLLENDFRNLSPDVPTTPQKGQNRKKSKLPVIEFRVGDEINYWAPTTTVGILSNLRTGIITQICSDEGWDDSDNMYECHLMVGTDPITYGSQIRPINTEEWIVTSSDSCKFIEGVLKGGSSASVGHLSDRFKRIDEAARTSFQYSPSGSDFSGDGAGDNDSFEPEKLGTPTSTATSSPQFSPQQFSLQDEDEGEVESFYNDQSQLPTGSKLVTLMVLAVGVVVDFMTTVVGDETTFTPPYPYSNFIAGKCPGFGKTKFTVTKKILAAEILRRSMQHLGI